MQIFLRYSRLFVFLIFGMLPACQNRPDEVRLLGWIGYEEADLLELIKSRTGIDVTVETFVGGDQMFTTLLRNPESYDLVVVDPEYVARLADSGVIAPLQPSDYDFKAYFPSLRTYPPSYVNGQLYSVLVRFGINGLLFNRQYLTAEDVQSYRILTSDKVQGRVLLFDWYLPNMGVFSRTLGNSAHPYELNQQEFEKLLRFMDEIRPNVLAVQSSFASMITALSAGDAWVQPTAGESLAWELQKLNPQIDWTVPQEGGVLWSETLAIPARARAPELASKVIQFLQSAEGQAALVRRKAYRSSVPNESAYALLTEQEKAVLKIHNREDAERILAKVSIRALPVNQSENDWQRAWTVFKSGS